MAELDPRLPRDDFTSTECAKILGGTIGALSSMANLEALSEAVAYWASPAGQEKIAQIYSIDRVSKKMAAAAQEHDQQETDDS